MFYACITVKIYILSKTIIIIIPHVMTPSWTKTLEIITHFLSSQWLMMERHCNPRDYYETTV